MASVTICSGFGAQENKVCHCFHCFSIYLPWGDGTGCHDLHFLNAELKPTFSLSSFTFINRLFSFSLLSAIRVLLSAYVSLLIFLLANLIPTCASSSLAFHMIYSEYKLNKQGDNIQPWHIPFPICKYYIKAMKIVAESESEVGQSCPTLCDPMDYSLPGSSAHGIFQARVLEWVAIFFCRGSSRPRDWTWVSRFVGRRFYHLSHQGSHVLLNL